MIRGMKVYELPPDENWKLELVTEIALLKKDHLEIDFDPEDLSFILDFICCKQSCWYTYTIQYLYKYTKLCFMYMFEIKSHIYIIIVKTPANQGPARTRFQSKTRFLEFIICNFGRNRNCIKVKQAQIGAY